MKSLTQEEKRVKIAQALGWSAMKDTTGFWRAVQNDKWHHKLWVSEENIWSAGIPDYFGDLNAMREAEKAIWAKEKEYIRNLLDMTQTPEDAIFATAEQRAEALGITLGLWS